MIKQYIDQVRQFGRVAFSSSEAMQALGISRAALGMALARLKQKGYLVNPYRDFYVPVPPEYQRLGCRPAEQLIPPLMKHINTPYYVCLLSAAALYGAAHQRPQIWQVMVSKRMRPIQCGAVVIHFVYREKMADVPTQQIGVPTGYLTVSTPEATCMDLLLYPQKSGGINHISTILAELVEAIDPDKLLQLARSSNEVAWVQRLGYILQLLDIDDTEQKNKCIELLSQYIESQQPSYVRLAPGKVKGCMWDKTWRVIANTTIESDI